MNYEITTDCELCIFVIYNVVYQGAFCPLVLCVPLRLFARLGLFDLYVLLASCVFHSNWGGWGGAGAGVVYIDAVVNGGNKRCVVY